MIASLIEQQMTQKEFKVNLGGEFNKTFDLELGCSGEKLSIKNCIKSLENITSAYYLIDIWRIRNPASSRGHKNP